MSDLLERLFEPTNAKDFAKTMKEAQELYPAPADFLEAVAAYLPTRLYEQYYGDSVPQSFFGFIAAAQSRDLFSEEEQWRPFVQQAWSAARERQRTPWSLTDAEPQEEGELGSRWQQFVEAAEAQDFSRAFGWARGFMNGLEGREHFREKSLSYALEDTALGGSKFLYLVQAWRLAEQLEWKHQEEILFAPLHFLVVAPENRELSREVKDLWRENPLPSLLKNEGEVSSDLYEKTERALLFEPSVSGALAAIGRLARAGASFAAVEDTLQLSASQALANSKRGSWLAPMRAFHFAKQVGYWKELVDPHRQTLALMMSAALLNQASRNSCEGESNRELDDVASHFLPTDPINVLKSVISHSDPHASATAVQAILGMGDEPRTELLSTLANQAVKNDGDVCGGNDLLYLQEAFDSYQRSSLPLKDRHLVSAGFFLGRIPKRYEVFGAYGF